MRRFASALGLSATLLFAACANDSTAPGRHGPQRDVSTLSGGACTELSVDEIKAHLTLLMAYVVPNDNSTLGKFDAVVAAYTAGDYPTAQTKLNQLIDFINLKYGQLSTAEQQTLITELDPDQTVSAFKDQVIAEMICFIAFDLNPGDPPKVFTNPEGTAGVWFPQDFVPVGTNVEVTTIDPNTDPLVTPFDKYPTYVEIKLVPEPANLNFANGKPVVAVCFPTTGPNVPSPTVADRLLLGHQKVPNDAAGFEMYEQVNVPSELADELVCQGGLDIAYTGVQKWLRKAADFFLPEKLHARFFGLGGVGGSPEEFSPFGAVDPMLAVGGAGGSPEEFLRTSPTTKPAKPAPKPAPKQASLVLPGGFTSNLTSGQVGTQATAGLPAVTVQTPGGDADGSNPVAGVTVTFTLGATDSDTDVDGDAHFCGATPPTSVVVTTNANGVAALPCIDFGTIAGYSNLKAVVDGSSLGYSDSNGNSLVIISNGATPAGNEVNFLIQATAGAAAKLTLEQAASSSAQAGVAFAQQPTLQLRDANNNLVLQADVAVTATIATGAGTLAGDLTVETDANGVATFTDLRIDGVTGARDLSFTSAYPAVAGGTVTITAGPAAKLAMVTEPAGARAGIAFTTQPAVEVQDGFGNDVAANGVTITAVVGTGAGTLMGTNTANTTGGVATFSNLRIDGLIGARTLDFSAPGLTGVSSASFNVTAGDATALAINTQPSATATAGVAFTQQPVIGLRDAFGNVATSPNVSVTASITAAGAGTLMGTLSRTTVSGVASFTDLRIDGVVGSRTLDFTSGSLTSVTSTAIVVGAGAASVVQTYMPTSAPEAAASYSYGTGLPVGPVSDPPQVRVTDAFGNPVANIGVTWSPASASNGATVTPGTGGATTSAAGLAQVSSWSLGDGFNQVIAEIAGSTTPATFTATGPSGQELFSCGLGGSKTDVGWLSIKTPNGTVRTVNLWMSVTGQSSTVATYPATVTVRKNGPTGAIIGGGSGGVTLPGNNGTATAVTFTLSDPAFQAESGGAQGQNTLWIELAFPGISPTRKMQVWYQNLKRPTGDCADARVYDPGSVTKSKPGLSIIVTN